MNRDTLPGVIPERSRGTLSRAHENGNAPQRSKRGAA